MSNLPGFESGDLPLSKKRKALAQPISDNPNNNNNASNSVVDKKKRKRGRRASSLASDVLRMLEGKLVVHRIRVQARRIRKLLQQHQIPRCCQNIDSAQAYLRDAGLLSMVATAVKVKLRDAKAQDELRQLHPHMQSDEAIGSNALASALLADTMAALKLRLATSIQTITSHMRKFLKACTQWSDDSGTVRDTIARAAGRVHPHAAIKLVVGQDDGLADVRRLFATTQRKAADFDPKELDDALAMTDLDADEKHNDSEQTELGSSGELEADVVILHERSGLNTAAETEKKKGVEVNSGGFLVTLCSGSGCTSDARLECQDCERVLCCSCSEALHGVIGHHHTTALAGFHDHCAGQEVMEDDAVDKESSSKKKQKKSSASKKKKKKSTRKKSGTSSSKKNKENRDLMLIISEYKNTEYRGAKTTNEILHKLLCSSGTAGKMSVSERAGRAVRWLHGNTECQLLNQRGFCFIGEVDGVAGQVNVTHSSIFSRPGLVGRELFRAPMVLVPFAIGLFDQSGFTGNLLELIQRTCNRVLVLGARLARHPEFKYRRYCKAWKGAKESDNDPMAELCRLPPSDEDSLVHTKAYAKAGSLSAIKLVEIMMSLHHFAHDDNLVNFVGIWEVLQCKKLQQNAFHMSSLIKFISAFDGYKQKGFKFNGCGEKSYTKALIVATAVACTHLVKERTMKLVATTTAMEERFKADTTAPSLLLIAKQLVQFAAPLLFCAECPLPPAPCMIDTPNLGMTAW